MSLLTFLIVLDGVRVYREGQVVYGFSRQLGLIFVEILENGKN